MNKLISRNPVQRFKQGRKIVKAQGGQRFVKAGNSTFNNTIWADSTTGDLYESNLDPNNPRNRVNLNPSSRSYLGKSTKVRNLLHGLFSPITINGSEYIRKTATPRGTKTPYNLSPEALKIVAARNAKLQNQKDQQKVINEEKPVIPIRKKTPINWQEKYNTFLGGLNTAQKNYLSREGVDYTNTEKLQEYLNSKGFGNRGTQGLDGKWGSRSQEAWNNFIAQTDFTPPQVEAPKESPIQLPTYVTAPTNRPTIAITQRLPTAKVFNRADTRDFIRGKGFGAYDFTGAQRRALRMVLNGQGTDEDKAIVKSMGLFKQGGILPSRNIIERFKQGKKIILAQKGISFKQAWNEARAKKQRYFNWNGKMYNSKAAGNDIEYETFADNMNEMSALLSTDTQPKHLGWHKNNPTSSELRGKDRQIRKQGTESTLPEVTIYGKRKQKSVKKKQPNYQVQYNVPMGAIEYVGRDGKQYWMRQDHSTGQYYYIDRNQPISYAKQVVPEGYVIPGANIAINKDSNIGKIALGLNKKYF